MDFKPAHELPLPGDIWHLLQSAAKLRNMQPDDLALIVLSGWISEQARPVPDYTENSIDMARDEEEASQDRALQ